MEEGEARTYKARGEVRGWKVERLIDLRDLKSSSEKEHTG